MGWGFLDWVRGRPYVQETEALTLPDEPSSDELRAMLMCLLDEKHAFDAYELLLPHGEQARPILEHLLDEDSRFRRMDEQVSAWRRPRFDVVLSVLREWGSEKATDEALALVDSQDPARRMIAARLLAETGQARFADQLLALTQDSDADVRLAVGHGLMEAANLESDLTRSLYEYMRSCALRTEPGPGKGFAAAMVAADPARAVTDFDSDEALTVERIWLDELIEALTTTGVQIAPERIRRLLDQALQRIEDTDEDGPRRF